MRAVRPVSLGYRMGCPGYVRVQAAYRQMTGRRSGITTHYGTGEAVITMSSANSVSIQRYLYIR